MLRVRRRGGRTPDITHLAIALIARRLKDAFSAIKNDVHGVPKDAAGAEALAAKDKHEFEKWIIGAIEGQPFSGGKKGMDPGDLAVAGDVLQALLTQIDERTLFAAS